MVNSNFAFIDPVSAVYYGGQAGYRAYQKDYLLDYYIEPGPAVICRTHTAPIDKFHLH